ncbi:MAG: DUF5320 family protein [Candidatus Cloacimonetes bacterium]|nr:DUF5320 family protein [Candidatus Cloacimonadota bacterium]
MAGRNGTGPFNEGPMTGRGLGPCGGGNRGGIFGFGRRMGRMGFGRGGGGRGGFGFGGFGGFSGEQEEAPQTSKSYLDNAINVLTNQLNLFKKQRKDLNEE